VIYRARGIGMAPHHDKGQFDDVRHLIGKLIIKQACAQQPVRRIGKGDDPVCTIVGQGKFARDRCILSRINIEVIFAPYGKQGRCDCFKLLCCV